MTFKFENQSKVVLIICVVMTLAVLAISTGIGLCAGLGAFFITLGLCGIIGVCIAMALIKEVL